MAKTIKLIELELENFTGHRSLKLEYGDITRLTGPNGAGKSSIGTAPVWVLYGTDLWGKRWSPKPTNYEADVTRAAMIIEVDGNRYKFERVLEGDNATYRMNDVPVKAKEYEAAVASLFDKDEFMVSYFPAYFFGLHWTKQRELVMKRTIPPARSEVLKQLPAPQVEKLDELLKKHTLDDLEKINRDRKNRLEKDHIAAQSRTKTLQEQLDRLPSIPGGFNIEVATAESAELLKQISEIFDIIQSADETNRKRTAIAVEIDSLKDQIQKSKERYMAVYNEQIQDTCPTCNRPMDDDSVKVATEAKEKRKRELRAEHEAMVTKRNEKMAELAKIEPVDVSEQWAKMREIERKRDELEDQIHAFRAREGLQADIVNARQSETDTLASLNESKFVLDAIKAYRAKEAELQAAKVQDLFTRLKIRLHEVQKNGEIKDAFMIQMDGKDYIQLSTGERMAAELELTEVLVKQSDMVTPLFFDNRESFTGQLSAFGQIIIAQATEGDGLKIETEGPQ